MGVIGFRIYCLESRGLGLCVQVQWWNLGFTRSASKGSMGVCSFKCYIVGVQWISCQGFKIYSVFLQGVQCGVEF